MVKLRYNQTLSTTGFYFLIDHKENDKDQYHFILVGNYCRTINRKAWLYFFILNQIRILQLYLTYDMVYANLIVQQQISGHTY